MTLYEQATAREDLGKDADFEYFLAWWYLRRGPPPGGAAVSDPGS